jgi:hypothetical protein
MDTVCNTKIVKFGSDKHEIPANMDKAGMVECWESDSRELKSLAQNIVDNNRKFAWEIVDYWLRKNNYLLIPKDREDEITTLKI